MELVDEFAHRTRPSENRVHIGFNEVFGPQLSHLIV
jgi:hypothetical protein